MCVCVCLSVCVCVCVCVCRLWILVTTYHLRISWHDTKWKITLWIPFDKWSLSITSSTWSSNFFKKIFWSVNCKLPSYKIYYIQTSTSWLVLRMQFQVRNCKPKIIPSKSHVTALWLHPWPLLWKGILNVHIKLILNL